MYAADIQAPDLRTVGQDNHRGYGGWYTSQIYSNIIPWLPVDDPDITVSNAMPGGQLPAGTPWARMYVPEDHPRQLYPYELPHVDDLVSIQYSDELTLTPEIEEDMKAIYAEWRQRYPKTLMHSNFAGEQTPVDTLAGVVDYMRATEPDMLMFDYYPGFTLSTPKQLDSRSRWYSIMQRYRLALLADPDS